VVRRAWELGATNDAWWMNHEDAFKKWGQAIDEAGLSWKYRQVLDGEWNVLERLGDERYRKQGGGGKGRIDRGELKDERLDAPLPWDVIDTGISKLWLQADLQKALEAMTVPDCAHTVCSECGVCDDDEDSPFFGGNVVFEPPPIPAFEGYYQPKSNVAVRHRVTFTKAGDMVFVGHLDLLNVIDRALRRAALPVAMDESPYSPRPRIVVGQPLPLGATAAAEVFEVSLTEAVSAGDLRARLGPQLPAGMSLVAVDESPWKKADGSLVENLPTLMEEVEYFLLLQDLAGEGAALTLAQAVAAVAAAPEIVVPHRTKRGRKTKRDLRGGLVSLDVADARETPLARYAEPLISRCDREAAAEGRDWVCVRAVGRVESGQLRLRADDVRRMLQEVADAAEGVTGRRAASSAPAGRRFEVVHTHRHGFSYRAPAPPRIDRLRIQNLLRYEGFCAIAQRNGEGPWKGGIDRRIDEGGQVKGNVYAGRGKAVGE